MALEHFFSDPRTLAKLHSGPLMLDGFRGYLADQGFSNETIRKHLCYVSHFNDYLRQTGNPYQATITARDVATFFEVYSTRCRCRGDLGNHLKTIRYAINRLIDYLTPKNQYDPLIPLPFYDPLLEDYLEWMRQFHQIAKGTLELHRHYLVKFLDWLGSQAITQALIELTGEQVEEFFVTYAQREGRSARRGMQGTLRTFLRFCHRRGYTRWPLDQAVPTMRTYKLSSVPRGLSEAQAQKILHSIDRNNAVGRRDYAIIMLLHTYGVRGGQVRALQLNDIQWSRNRILFRPIKNGKESLLPLTADVGESLLDYLDARPRCSFPEVFLTSKAPIHPLPRTNTLSAIVRHYILLSGIEVQSKGAHAFRHAFATRMLGEGRSLKDIADILGHRHLATTFIYTKVDFNALKQAALEWPTEVETCRL